jgi:hypothetical protein
LVLSQVFGKTNNRDWHREFVRTVENTNNDKSILPRNTFKMLRHLSRNSEKVVFLNDKNLEVLKGYKAYVQVKRQGEIHVVITGLNKDSSQKLFDDLEALNTAEITSDNE